MKTAAEKLAYTRARRDTKDPTVGRGSGRSARVDLGLELLARRALPGEPITRYDIAVWCGVTDAAIFMIERKALRKLANRFKFGGESRLGREVRAA